MTRLALLQMTSGIDPAANAACVVDAIAEAAAGGAAMLFTPEMTGLVDRDRDRAAASVRAEDDDIVLKAARGAAAEHGIWLHLGSLALRRPDGRLANRGFVIDAAGAVRARYDKLHLFDVDLPTGESWRESSTYAAGEGPWWPRRLWESSASPSATTSALPRSMPRSARPGRRCSASRLRSPDRPVPRIGICFSAPGRSNQRPL